MLWWYFWFSYFVLVRACYKSAVSSSCSSNGCRVSESYCACVSGWKGLQCEQPEGIVALQFKPSWRTWDADAEQRIKVTLAKIMKVESNQVHTLSIKEPNSSFNMFELQLHLVNTSSPAKTALSDNTGDLLPSLGLLRVIDVDANSLIIEYYPPPTDDPQDESNEALYALFLLLLLPIAIGVYLLVQWLREPGKLCFDQQDQHEQLNNEEPSMLSTDVKEEQEEVQHEEEDEEEEEEVPEEEEAEEGPPPVATTDNNDAHSLPHCSNESPTALPAGTFDQQAQQKGKDGQASTGSATVPKQPSSAKIAPFIKASSSASPPQQAGDLQGIHDSELSTGSLNTQASGGRHTSTTSREDIVVVAGKVQVLGEQACEQEQGQSPTLVRLTSSGDNIAQHDTLEPPGGDTSTMLHADGDKGKDEEGAVASEQPQPVPVAQNSNTPLPSETQQPTPQQTATLPTPNVNNDNTTTTSTGSPLPTPNNQTPGESSPSGTTPQPTCGTQQPALQQPATLPAPDNNTTTSTGGSPQPASNNRPPGELSPSGRAVAIYGANLQAAYAGGIIMPSLVSLPSNGEGNTTQQAGLVILPAGEATSLVVSTNGPVQELIDHDASPIPSFNELGAYASCTSHYTQHNDALDDSDFDLRLHVASTADAASLRITNLAEKLFHYNPYINTPLSSEGDGATHEAESEKSNKKGKKKSRKSSKPNETHTTATTDASTVPHMVGQDQTELFSPQPTKAIHKASPTTTQATSGDPSDTHTGDPTDTQLLSEALINSSKYFERQLQELQAYEYQIRCDFDTMESQDRRIMAMLMQQNTPTILHKGQVGSMEGHTDTAVQPTTSPSAAPSSGSMSKHPDPVNQGAEPFPSPEQSLTSSTMDGTVQPAQLEGIQDCNIGTPKREETSKESETQTPPLEFQSPSDALNHSLKYFEQQLQELQEDESQIRFDFTMKMEEQDRKIVILLMEHDLLELTRVLREREKADYTIEQHQISLTLTPPGASTITRDSPNLLDSSPENSLLPSNEEVSVQQRLDFDKNEVVSEQHLQSPHHVHTRDASTGSSPPVSDTEASASDYEWPPALTPLGGTQNNSSKQRTEARQHHKQQEESKDVKPTVSKEDIEGVCKLLQRINKRKIGEQLYLNLIQNYTHFEQLLEAKRPQQQQQHQTVYYQSQQGSLCTTTTTSNGGTDSPTEMNNRQKVNNNSNTSHNGKLIDVLHTAVVSCFSTNEVDIASSVFLNFGLTSRSMIDTYVTTCFEVIQTEYDSEVTSTVAETWSLVFSALVNQIQHTLTSTHKIEEKQHKETPQRSQNVGHRSIIDSPQPPTDLDHSYATPKFNRTTGSPISSNSIAECSSPQPPLQTIIPVNINSSSTATTTTTHHDTTTALPHRHNTTHSRIQDERHHGHLVYRATPSSQSGMRSKQHLHTLLEAQTQELSHIVNTSPRSLPHLPGNVPPNRLSPRKDTNQYNHTRTALPPNSNPQPPQQQQKPTTAITTKTAPRQQHNTTKPSNPLTSPSGKDRSNKTVFANNTKQESAAQRKTSQSLSIDSSDDSDNTQLALQQTTGSPVKSSATSPTQQLVPLQKLSPKQQYSPKTVMVTHAGSPRTLFLPLSERGSQNCPFVNREDCPFSDQGAHQHAGRRWQ